VLAFGHRRQALFELLVVGLGRHFASSASKYLQLRKYFEIAGPSLPVSA
jgi:hypothetical protein